MRDVFTDRTFHAASEGYRRFVTEAALRHASPGPLNILDLGCGSGRQLIELGDAFPEATLVGIDVSFRNSEVARKTTQRSSEQIRIECADYMAFETDGFDIIVTDSVLQHIAAEDDDLYEKLTADIRPNGLLVATLPYGCVYNHAIWLARRAIRVVRGRCFDRIILNIARRLHGRNWDDEALRDRIPYAYLLPHHYEGAKMRMALRQTWGFSLEEIAPLPHRGLAVPKHRLVVWRKCRASQRQR